MTTVTAARLVAAREIRVRLRDKTFLLSTVFFLLFSAAATVLPAVLGGGRESVAVADRATAARLDQAGLEVRVVADDQAAEKLVRAGTVDAAVVSGPQVLALENSPDDVVRALSQAPPVRLLAPSDLNPFLAFIVPVVLALVVFFISFMFGLQIAQSVTEEKQTRIVEILVSSVPTRALLAGKIAALGTLAFAQVALIGLVTLAGAGLGGVDSAVLASLRPAIGWFLAFFLVGFLMLAALWAAAGALVSRMEDLQSVSQPVQMAVMLPFFAVVFLMENDTAMRVMSFIPFSAPSAMPARIFNGDAAVWEPFVALLVMAATAIAFLLLGARVYEGSLLRTNGKTSWGAALRSRSTA
jgi:ABC-2 type transport system permease protein